MPKKKKNILLIDDDTSLLVTLRDFLKFEGYHVVTADSGEKGLEELDGYEPDLIILDMSMPGMGGLGFLKAITGETGKPAYPVLVLTARSGMAEYFGDVDVQGFVAKPCDPQDLLMEVGRIIFLTSDDAVSEGTASGRQVLLGEDREEIRAQVQKSLRAAGYEVVCAERATDVIERAILDRPDVILMKLLFGNMNGDTVARMLGEMAKTQDIPVILYDDSGGELSAEDFGVKGSTIKKFVRANDAGGLTAAVTELFG